MAEAAQRATERERGGGAAARAHGIPAPAEATPEALPLPGAESRHAALLADPRMGELGAAQRARLMRQLQRGGGNSYAERVVSRAQATAARPASTAATGAPEAAVAEEPQETAGLAAPLTARAVAPAPPAAGEPTVRRSWVGNAFNAVAGAVSGDGLLRTVAGLARNLPGYSMLGLVLGRDPISGDAIDRSPKNVLRAVMGLVPVVGEQLFLAMDEAGAIDKAFAWADEQLKQLGLNFDLIKATFKKAWDALSLKDAITNPGGTWDKLKGIFLEPINKIKSFVGAALEKVKEFIFEAVMERLGGGPVMGLLQKAGGAFNAIIKDPIGFVGNLISGVGQGLKQFGANILTHLKKGLQSWLFGALAEGGIAIPEKFDLKGIVTLILSLLGLTWASIRARLAKVLPDWVLTAVEKAVAVVQILATEGVGGLWKWVVEKITDLKEQVMSQIKDFVITKIITAGITWLISLLNPAAAFIKACKMIYDAVMWFADNAQRLGDFVSSVLDSVEAIAAGGVGKVAGLIENTLGKALPMVISGLASLLGLGGISDKIKKILQTIQKPVGKVVDGIIKGVVKYGKKLLGKLKRKKEDPAAEEKRLNKGLMAGKAVVDRLPGKLLKEAMASPALAAVKLAYRMPKLELVAGKTHYEVQRATTAKTNKKVAKHPSKYVGEDGKTLIGDYRGQQVREWFYKGKFKKIPKQNAIDRAIKGCPTGKAMCAGYNRPRHRVDVTELQIDHVVPVAYHWSKLGGNNTTQEKRYKWYDNVIDKESKNLMALCKACNGAKSSHHKGKKWAYTEKVGPKFKGWQDRA